LLFVLLIPQGPRACRTADTRCLPVGHTCLNRLDLPAYEDKATLVQKLSVAVRETQGFGIV
jgi:hypothetical protein